MSAVSNTPTVSVLLPVYNASQFLREAIDSILAQTRTDFELLIINDGSTDDSATIIASYSDARIRVLMNEKNIGLIASLNRGIAEAKGKYIARMDADDIALPLRLQLQVDAMDRDPGVAVLAGYVDFINIDGEVTGHWSTDRTANTEAEIRSLMQRTNCIAHPTVMMRTGIARRFLYHPKRKGAEDWDLWMRVLAAGYRIAKLKEVLLHYRVHPGSITASDKQEDVLEMRLIRFKHRWLWSQFWQLKLNGFFFGVKISLLKNIARHIVSNTLPKWARDLKRYLTSPPWKVISEGRNFRQTLNSYSGKHFFIFPYMHVGGAEMVHADIVSTVSDCQPLVIFPGFSMNDKFLSRFTRHATVLDVAHYVNYPLTRKKAKQLLAERITANRGVVFGSNAGLFYDLIPALNKEVRVIDLIHAFMYQPQANLAHRKLLPLAARIDQRIFVSRAAADEFRKFCYHNNIPKSVRERIRLIGNAVEVPELMNSEQHDKPGVLWVGRNSPEKRYELFQKISQTIQQKHPDKFRFSSVGVRDVSAGIHSHGEIADSTALRKVYRENDILLVTSSREGFPMVIMEAMAEGLVVIATPVGDVPNRLDGTNGIVLRASSDAEQVVAECVNAIELLTSDPERMKQMRKSAHDYALKHFSFGRFRYEYRELLNADRNS